MALFYNGLQLKIDSLQELSRAPVYHGHKFLYMRVRLRVNVVLNPGAFAGGATHYEYVGQPGGIVEDRAGAGRFAGTTVANLNAAPGRAGPLTEKEIIHALTTPRRLLIYTAESIGGGQPEVEWVISPQRKPGATGQYYTCDATGGPRSLGARVVKRHGVKTVELEVGWETDISNCTLFSTGPSPLLSHRFSMQRVVDQDFYAKRVIRGEAHFRLDRLEELQAKADDYIQFLAHPVPDNMQRIHTEAIPNQEGTEVHFLLVDQEKPHNIASFAKSLGCTRIEAYFRNSIGRLGSEAAVGEILTGAIDTFGKISADPIRDSGLLVNFIGNGLKTAVRTVPTTRRTLVVRCWGHRQTSRAGLLRVAHVVMTHIFGAEDVIMSTVGSEVVEDLAGRFIELSIALERGPVNSVIRLGNSAIANVAELFSAGEEIPGVLTAFASPNPAPVGDGLVRGTFTGQLVSQALLGPCAVPSRPTNPGKFVPREP